MVPKMFEPLKFDCFVLCTMKPVLIEHQRGNQKTVAYDRCLLNIGSFVLIYTFTGPDNCHLSTDDCLIDVAFKTV